MHLGAFISLDFSISFDTFQSNQIKFSSESFAIDLYFLYNKNKCVRIGQNADFCSNARLRAHFVGETNTQR